MPLADFISHIALNSNRDLFQSTLSVEQGGMNEVFVDIYSITGDKKFLQTAERFNHINVIIRLLTEKMCYSVAMLTIKYLNLWE